MALDPDFVDNGRIYVSYAYDAVIGQAAPRWGSPGGTNDPCPDPPGSTEDGCVISGRLSVLTNGANEQVLINDWCQQYPSHSMGDIVFDAEGALILSSGDGANFNAPDWGQWGGDDRRPRHPRTRVVIRSMAACPMKGRRPGRGAGSARRTSAPPAIRSA